MFLSFIHDVNTWRCLLSCFMTSYMTIFWCSIIDKCQLNSRTWTTEESHSGLVASDLLNLTYNHMYVCCLLFSVRLENISLILRHRHCEWRAAEFRPGAWYLWPLSRERSLSCHTGYDTGFRFLRPHPKDYTNLIASFDKQKVPRTYIVL